MFPGVPLLLSFLSLRTSDCAFKCFCALDRCDDDIFTDVFITPIELQYTQCGADLRQDLEDRGVRKK